MSQTKPTGGKYRYATILRALNDGKPPNDNIEEGDEIVKPGKHESDEITYLTEDRQIATIRFEQSQVIDGGEAGYTESEIIDFAGEELYGEEYEPPEDSG